MATGTNNPPGSDNPLDLRANAQNLDLLLLGPNASYPSRLGVQKRSWAGINSAYDSSEANRNLQFQQFLDSSEAELNLQFQQFLEASGFEYPPLAYVDGVPLQVDRSTQTIERAGNIYTVKVPNIFPFTLTGTFATDTPDLVLRNDQTLRQDLAAQNNPAKGAGLWGYRGRTGYDRLSDRRNVKDGGAKVDGVTDDTADTQALIDELFAEGGGVIDIGEGTLMTTGLTYRDRVILNGAGKGVTIIKLIAGSNNHVIQAGDFDVNADGMVKATPIGCRSAGISNLTIDGNKSAQTVAKHGLAHYGIDLSIFNVESKNCKGWGIYTESPGGTFSVVAGQNLQYSVSGVECHDNDLGNFLYNGQSDSNLSDIMCYECGGNGAGQANLKLGSKATGVRLVGGHCWGVSAYGVINEAELPEFSDFHVESALTAKVWAKEKITWTGGHIYEAGSNTAAVGFKLDKDYNNIRGARATNIRGGLIDTSAGGVAGQNSIVEVFGYTGAAGSTLSVGTISTSSDVEIRLFGLTTASLFQRARKQTLLGGLDMASSGIDRANYFAGQGWASVTVSANTISADTSFVVLNEAAPVNVTDITSLAGQLGILELTIRNGGANAVTFVHNTAKLRNNSGANIVLAQFQSVKYTFVSGVVWQQTGGKI